MSDIDQLSVWVSGLTPPLDMKDIAKFFSRAGKIHEVLIPDVNGTDALIRFTTVDAVDDAITYHGRSFRDDVLEVTVPTPEQLAKLEGDGKSPDTKQSVASHGDVALGKFRESVSGLNRSELESMMTILTSVVRLKDLDADDGAKSMPAGVTEPRVRASSLSVEADTNLRTRNALHHSPTHVLHQPLPAIGNYTQPPYVQNMQYPRISNFSGDFEKGDVPYLQWRNEVGCLMSEYHPIAHILHSIRRSIRGTAAEVLLNIGQGVDPAQILSKFDVIFGPALSSQALLEDFYSARQKENENAVRWACRLESMLNLVRDQGIISGDIEAMKRSKFWSGLKSDHMKNALRHRFDAGENIKGLLTAARAVEHEMQGDDGLKVDFQSAMRKGSGKSAKVQVQEASVTSTLEQKMDKMMDLFAAFSSRIEKVEKTTERRHNEKKTKYQQSGTTPKTTQTTYKAKEETRDCFYCHEPGHLIADCPKLAAKKAKDEGKD